MVTKIDASKKRSIAVDKADAKVASFLQLIAPSRDKHKAALILGQTFYFYSKCFEKTLKPTQLTISQFVTLWALLFSQGRLTPTDIARALPIETHSVSAMLDRLEERKLVKRQRSRQDRRSVKVALTAQGEQLITEIFPKAVSLNEKLYQDLSSRQLQLLSNLAGKIRNAALRRLGANPVYSEVILKKLLIQT